jgi:low temperature requirement protein LtrA
MRARSADEPHRVSTPIELFVDLCFVVTVAQALETRGGGPPLAAAAS